MCDRLRVASYNIHRCQGSDGQYRPDRIRQVIHELDAQVIALQEVETGRQHGELLEYLVGERDWNIIEGPTLERNTGRYGNAVLTSLPVISHRARDLSFGRREPRAAIDLELDSGGRPIRLIATHLGLMPGERRHQTRQLLDWIGPPNDRRDRITLLVGDLNEWFLWGRPLRWLKAWFGGMPARPSFPARWPLFALDRIWVHPGSQLLDIQVIRTPVARQASDHLPVVGTLKLD